MLPQARSVPRWTAPSIPHPQATRVARPSRWLLARSRSLCGPRSDAERGQQTARPPAKWFKPSSRFDRIERLCYTELGSGTKPRSHRSALWVGPVLRLSICGLIGPSEQPGGCKPCPYTAQEVNAMPFLSEPSRRVEMPCLPDASIESPGKKDPGAMGLLALALETSTRGRGQAMLPRSRAWSLARVGMCNDSAKSANQELTRHKARLRHERRLASSCSFGSRDGDSAASGIASNLDGAGRSPAISQH
jgi:hypothetical protein